MKWKVDSCFPNIVRDITGRFVCNADTSELAETIVRDHNLNLSDWTKEQIDAMHDEAKDRRVPKR